MSKDLLDYQSYLLVIPHPDDEVNCAALLARILQQGKGLSVVLITNGSAGQNADLRASEMKRSLDAIGLAPEQFHTLNVPEEKLLQSFPQTLDNLKDIVNETQPDCLLTLDFDGGHEGHDASNFLASKAIEHSTTDQIVFPDYHFRNMERYGLEFLPDRNPDYQIELTDQEKDLKIALLEAHAGQIGFYLRMQKRQANYFELLFSREIYRDFPTNFNYLARPTYQIGYEHHRNGFKFTDFLKAAESV